MSKVLKPTLVVAAGLAATALIAQQPVAAPQSGVPPHLGGIDTLPAVTFRENLAETIRIHRGADPARVSRAVADAFAKVGYAGLGPRAAAILDAVHRDPGSDAGDVLNAIDRLGGSWAGGQVDVAKRHYAASNAYGRAYAMGPVGRPLTRDNPRPWQVSPLIRRDPRLGADYSAGSPAYPSGHTTDGYTQSLLLAMIFPERARQILARASDYAESRIVLGVHYPLDVIGGRILATSAIVRLLTERSSAFGVSRPRGFAAAAGILRADLARRCAVAAVANGCDDGSTAPYPGLAQDRAAYRARLTYGMVPVSATDRPAIVPRNAEMLLATRFPYLDARQRRDILATTEIPSGYALDDGSGYARLDLFAAAGGYGAFSRTATIRMNAADGPIAARDVFSNDIHGPGGLIKLGDGTLVLAGNNDFAGGITIRGGAVVADAKGLGRGPVRNDATLMLDAQANERIDVPITGTGRIVKTGTGTLELTAIAGFRGVIAVKGGQIILRCSAAAGGGMVRQRPAHTTTRILDRSCALKTNP